MRRKAITIIFVVILGILAATYGAKVYIENGLLQLKEMSISEVDMLTLKNGTYAGSYRVFPIAVEVEVTVNNHRITNIELVKHSNGQGSKAEGITNMVIEAQGLGVDMVSGATYSSKVILKAIENALSSAK
ncbi:MAG: hypothetical protein K0Q99_1440 [Clostridia bacterium]|jgi:uncharacterized protein with FMN-binding domain|nr:hypothetical protein [Clostridia bacterium]